MSPQTRAALDYLDTLLAVGDESAQELATVLSALRGPDLEDDAHLKELTTARIRAVAFPSATGSSYHKHYIINSQWRVNNDGFPIHDDVTCMAMSDHFGLHVRTAARVLGILER